MTPFACSHCGSPVFFESHSCLRCGARLGFDPDQRRMLAYEPTAIGQPWQSLQAAEAATTHAATTAAPRHPCSNREPLGVCNWMADADATEPALCRSCQLTRTVPDLTVAGHAAAWARVEAAKRRLLFGLGHLGLMPLSPRRDPVQRGLCFDLLARGAGAEDVRTGHEDGVITLDMAEADDAYRETQRLRLGEPARTLLGHLRHETAHYLQFRWIDHDPERLAAWRATFGDERQDYAEALQRHYDQGPPADWAQHHVSAYASAHPWEDWAETCAHWMLIVDAVQTAGAWGLQLDGPAASTRAPSLGEGQGLPADASQLVLAHWLPVAQFLNAMNRSIGGADSYPYLLPPAVVTKLEAVRVLLSTAPEEALA